MFSLFVHLLGASLTHASGYTLLSAQANT